MTSLTPLPKPNASLAHARKRYIQRHNEHLATNLASYTAAILMPVPTSSSAVHLRTAKQKLTRQLHALQELVAEADEFRPQWSFPTDISELRLFLSTNKLSITSLKGQMEEQIEKIWALYDSCISALSTQEDKETAEKTFDEYWEERHGDKVLALALAIKRQLDKRLTELECQTVALKLSQDQQTGSNQSNQQDGLTTASVIRPLSELTIEQKLLSSELKVPEFHGNPLEFGPFWELFEELVHKQPYSNISKLSILLSCCKGDAARSLRMIPRTGEAYERAIQQLKNQYEDPRRIKMHTIRQLRTMKPCQDDPRSLRNNLSDIQAIVATMKRQGEVVDSTYLTNLVTETFSKSVQEEIARKEFDTETQWTMDELLNNLTTIIRRREHLESHGNNYKEQHSIFHTQVREQTKLRCTGCGNPHRFENCNKYRTVTQKQERLKSLNACWKCFSQKHTSNLCYKRNCTSCGGRHNPVICPRKLRSWRATQQLEDPPSKDTRTHRRDSSLQRMSPHQPIRKPIRGERHPRSRRFSFRSEHPSEQPQKHEQNRNPQPLSRARSKSHPRTARVTFASVSRSQSPNLQEHKSLNVNFQNSNEAKFCTDTVYTRMMIVAVNIYNEAETCVEKLYAILDSASDQSFISTPVAERLGLPVLHESTIIVNTFGGHAEKKQVKKVNTSLLNCYGERLQVTLVTCDKITPALPIRELDPEDKAFLQQNFSTDEILGFSESTSVTPQILIGIDYFNLILKLNEPILRMPSGLFIAPTFFGPVISGAHQEFRPSLDTSRLYYSVINSCTAENGLEHLPDYSDLWKLPAVGTEDLRTDEELNDQIIKDFYSTVKIVDGRIYVQFPWKPNKHHLNDNYNLALSRLHQLCNMRTKNPKCWKEYCNIIEEQINKQFVEDAPETPNTMNPTYYIPHQAVIKPTNATTKTRIVLDGSSKMKGQLSLNDVIHQGPLILPNLCGILLRSRLGSKILLADVEKAFHMIYLQNSERDSVRFLWLKNTSQPPHPANIRILRFCRLPFGINASPFLLGASIRYGIQQQKLINTEIHEQLLQNLYVDNILILGETTHSLIKSYKICKQTFTNMSMNLRQFITNDALCNEIIDHKDRTVTPLTKILGIPWNHIEDTLTLVSNLQYDGNTTKRKVLQAIHLNFDPLGLLAPLFLPAKIFLQDLWKIGYEWDEPLRTNHEETWRNICQNTHGFKISLPRALIRNKGSHQYELHSFVDASTRSFAAAVYLRTIDSQGAIGSHIMMGRQRLAPINTKIKTMTIPRLELLAILIGVRLTKFIIKEITLSINAIRLYSDSQVALHWIQSSKSNGTFVDNRCKEIRETLLAWSEQNLTCTLHYITSELNPADCATKGLTKQQFEHFTWWSGPPFLQLSDSEWPNLPQFCWENKENEAKENPPVITMALFTTHKYHDPIFQRQFSTLNKLRKTTTLVLKFLKEHIYNKLSRSSQTKVQEHLPEICKVTTAKPLVVPTAGDVVSAERLIIRLMQRSLSANDVQKWDNLTLYKDNEGIVRCKGRIRAKHLNTNTLYPILLLPNHPLTGLIVREFHCRSGHQGVNGTLANLRLLYWIPKGRQVVKKSLKSCIICKRWNNKPYFYPDSPPLPYTRTQPTRPFTNIGIDLAGPFTIYGSDGNKAKRWIFLATCMTTRAIHLEVVNNTSATQTINMLRRLVARRGKPKLIISDNAPNFVLGNTILSTTNNGDKSHVLKQFLANEIIEWKFITPLSPWKGGFYERMVGIMKSIFKRVSGKKTLEETDFVTIITECEAMANSRPLTYTGSTIEDSLIIRPIDFIIPYSDITPFTSLELEDSNDDDYLVSITTKDQAVQYFQKQMNHLQRLWDCWTKTYLLELRNYHQRRIKQKIFTRTLPKVGEVVLITDEDTSRGHWPLGLITRLIHDQDEKVRSVELRTAKSTLTRSIQMLIPLELDNNEQNSHTQQAIKSKVGKQQINQDNEWIMQDGSDTTAQINDANTQRAESEADEDAQQAKDNTAQAAVSHHSLNNQRDNSAQLMRTEKMRRTRPMLPRRAKENKTYNVNTATREADNPTHYQSITHLALWKYWITLSTLAILITTTNTTEIEDTQLRCVTGGINLQMTTRAQTLQVCGNDYCLEMQQPEQNVTVQFPAEVTLHSYHVTVKSIHKNQTKALLWACPPSPFCEQIACNFCAQMISNPECWPKIAIAVTAILIYSLVISVYCIARILKRTSRAIIRILGYLRLYRSSTRRPANDSFEEIPLLELNRVKTRWNTTTAIKLLAILTIFEQSIGCQQNIIISSKYSQCRTDNNCRNQTTLIAQLNQMQPEMCIKVKQGTSSQHYLRISVQQLILRCRKESLYYTRNTKTRVQYVKRCPHMGTCTGIKCAKINSNTLIDELQEANNYTGITYCSESCGGLGCSCGFPSSGCLFYRIYHVPIDNEIYEVYQCPSWFETILIEMHLNRPKHRPLTLELKPYVKKNIDNITLEITSFTFTPNSMLHHRYITNERMTAYILENTKFTYACSTDPRITAISNLTDNCIVDDTCKCNPAEDSVSCYCRDNNVNEIAQLHNTLPLPLPHGQVDTEGQNRVPTIRTSALSADISITFDHTTQEITQEIQDFNCGTFAQQLLGCYNCVKGAIATIFCKSNKPQSLAQVTCGLQEFTLTCTRDGTYNQIRLFFNKAQVYELCRAQCGYQTTMFELKGTLNYVNGMKPLWKIFKLWDNNTNTNNSFDIDFALPDFSHFLSICKQFLIYTVTVSFVLLMALLTSVVYLAVGFTTKKRSTIPMTILAFPPIKTIWMLLRTTRRIICIPRLVIKLCTRIVLAVVKLIIYH